MALFNSSVERGNISTASKPSVAAWAQPAPRHDRDATVYNGYTRDRDDVNHYRGDRDDRNASTATPIGRLVTKILGK